MHKFTENNANDYVCPFDVLLSTKTIFERVKKVLVNLHKIIAFGTGIAKHHMLDVMSFPEEKIAKITHVKLRSALGFDILTYIILC